MAREESVICELNDGFYRDGFKKVVILLVSWASAILLLITASVFLILTKPPPQYFIVNDGFRLQAEVPVSQPFLNKSDVLQWVNDAVRVSFSLDFLDYREQLKNNRSYFTSEGYRVYQNQLNNYVDYNTVKSSMYFAEATPASAPTIINDGLLSGRYAWWVQMPIRIKFTGVRNRNDEELALQILVVRVPTKDNLAGIAIENIIIDTEAGGKGELNAS